MTEPQKVAIKEYVTVLDKTIVDGEYLDLLLDIVADRVLLYLNTLVLDPALNRIVAQVVLANYNSLTRQNEQTVSSVSDNGQTVSYHQTPVQHFGTKGDSELFSGFEKLLASHRRVHVITS